MERLRVGICWLGLALLVAPAGGAQSPVEGTALVAYDLELRASSDAEPAAASVRWTGTETGTLYVHVLASDFEPALEARRVDTGQVLLRSPDDASSRLQTLELAYDAGIEALFVVTARDGARNGKARLMIGVAPDSPEVLAARDAWESRLSEGQRLATDGRLGEARALLLELLGEVDATPGVDVSAIGERIRFGCTLVLRNLDRAADVVATARKLVEFRERFMPQGHQRILSAQRVLATLLRLAQEFPEALAILTDAVEQYREVLPPSDQNVLLAKLDLAAILIGFERHEEALELQLSTLEVLDVPGEPVSPLGLYALSSAAASYGNLGDPARAAHILERVVDAHVELGLESTPPHVGALRSLGTARLELGDYASARFLFERVLELQERLFLETGMQSIRSRLELAMLELTIGETASARGRLESAAALLDGELEEDAPLRERVHSLLTGAWIDSHEFERAQSALVERAQRLSRNLPERRAALGQTEQQLGLIAVLQSRFSEALTHLDRAIELYPAHPEARDPQLARLAGRRGQALLCLGRLEEARESLENALERCPILQDSMSWTEQGLRVSLAKTLDALDEPHAMREQLMLVAVGLQERALTTALRLSTRESQLLMEGSSWIALSTSIRLMQEAAPEHRQELVEAMFSAVESIRNAATVAFHALRLMNASADAESVRLRRDLQLASEKLAQVPNVDDDHEARDRVVAALQAHAQAERGLRNHLLRRMVGSGELPKVAPAEIAERLDPDEAFIGYWVFGALDAGAPLYAHTATRHLCAFVLRHDRPLAFADLGPLDSVADAVSAWRRDVAEGRDDGPTGGALLDLAIRPLLPELEGARTLRVAADHALHFVPLDALPLDGGRLGDRFGVVAEPSLVQWRREANDAEEEPLLLAIGGVEYGPLERTLDAASSTSTRGNGLRRGGFEPLPNTRYEVEEIAALHGSALGDSAPSRVLRGADATRAAFFEDAPRARFLHLATHGYFEPFGAGAEPAVAEDLIEMAETELQGLAPMTLCGVALAGANAGRSAAGSFEGIVTAQELASLDLSGCELAVLSACETHLGVVRPGVGVASLQKALHAAGVRRSVTSLWRVPDTATRELMGAFYRALWVDGLSTADALWRAKQSLRQRRAPVSDWAGWVLSEAP